MPHPYRPTGERQDERNKNNQFRGITSGYAEFAFVIGTMFAPCLTLSR